MKSTALSKLLLCTTVVMFSLSACGQSETVNSAATQPVAQEQGDWKTITAEADEASKKGDKVVAEAKYKEAMAAAVKLGESDPGQAVAIANLASFYYVQGDANQANDLYTKSLAAHEKAVGLEHVDLVTDLVGLAKVKTALKQPKEAVTNYERAINILKNTSKPVPADLQAEYDAAKKAAA